MEIWLERYKNSQGILDPYKYWDTPILVVGAGWIWSTVVVNLAKMWMKNITVVDFDTVEDHNLQSQFYRQQDIGKLKVDALKEIVIEQAGIEINTINAEFSPEMTTWMQIVLPLVDNNDIRKEIIDASVDVPHIIDARMWWTFFEIYNMHYAERSDYYADFWYPQSEVTATVCSEKSSCFNCFASAAVVCSVIRARLIDYNPPVRITIDLSQYIFDIWF